MPSTQSYTASMYFPCNWTTCNPCGRPPATHLSAPRSNAPPGPSTRNEDACTRTEHTGLQNHRRPGQIPSAPKGPLNLVSMLCTQQHPVCSEGHGLWIGRIGRGFKAALFTCFRCSSPTIVLWRPVRWVTGSGNLPGGKFPKPRAPGAAHTLCAHCTASSYHKPLPHKRKPHTPGTQHCRCTKSVPGSRGPMTQMLPAQSVAQHVQRRRKTTEGNETGHQRTSSQCLTTPVGFGPRADPG